MNTLRTRAARRNDDGFTLIELLVVIAILGILAAIAVFSVSGITNNADDSACESNRNLVQTASEAYFAENDEYPAAGSDLVPGFLSSFPTGDNMPDVTWSKTAAPVIDAC